MRKDGNLEQYELRLKTDGPVFVGTGASLSKVEYCYFPAKGLIAVLDDDRFLDYLVARRLTDLYEAFMGRAAQMDRVDLMRDFLRPNLVTEADVSKFTAYTIRVQGSLDDGHSRKEIYLFHQNAAHEPYIPGSSVKGALRTAILTKMLLEKPWSGAFSGGKFDAANLETAYLNTRNLTGKQSDPKNSVMHGLSISDSLPVPREKMALYQKEDLFTGEAGETKRINLLRECAVPGTEFRFSLTVDRKICPAWDAEFLLDCLRKAGEFYKKTYLPAFPAYRGKFPASETPMLFLGGGSGYAAKNVVYPARGYAGKDTALRETAAILRHRSPEHGHEKDEARGASPHMLKIARGNGSTFT